MDKILVVDDDVELRSIVIEVLRGEGFAIAEAGDGMEAVRGFGAEQPDAVLLDLKMPYMDGMETMSNLLSADPAVPVVILTAHGDLQTAVQAIKAGAYDFSVKPPDFGHLVVTLRRAVEKRRLSRKVAESYEALRSSLRHTLGRGAAISRVVDEIERIAPTDLSIILEGETGTGKSVIAHLIHAISRRSGGPFVAVDMGLIPEHLAESELFGYRKGAFTGAERDKRGYFESAAGGTIFIDELENISPVLQGKLLSVVETKTFTPLGSTTKIPLDLRIIAATNSDIRHCVAVQRFRPDLFYRLGEMIVTIPPLRQRIDDIPFFAQRFLLDAATELNRQMRGISDEAFILLSGHVWPGNLRELKNVIRRAVLSADSDTVEPRHLQFLVPVPEPDAQPAAGGTLKDAVRDLERRMIGDALKKTGGNKTKAADILDMSYTSLLAKIKEYGILA